MQAIKLPEDNTAEHWDSCDFSNDFLETIPSPIHEKQFEKLNFIKMKNFCFVKVFKRMKKQAINLEKIFTKHICDKGMVSKHKEILKFNNEKTSNLFEIWAKDLNRLFTKEGKQMKFSTSLVI